MHTSFISLMQRIQGWRLVVIVSFVIILMVELIVSAMNMLLKGEISSDYLITGLVAACIATPFGVLFVGRICKESTKSTHDALKASAQYAENSLEAAIDAAQMLYWELDLTNGFIRYDDNNLQWLGVDTQFPAHTLTECLTLVHPDDRVALKERFQTTLKVGARNFEFEFRIALSAETWGWIQARGKVTQRDKSGKAVFASGGCINITERKRIEDEIAAKSRQLQATIDAVPDLLFEVDLDGRIYDYHARNGDVLAAPPEVFLGKTITEVLPPEAAAICMSAIQEASEQGRSFGKEYVLSMPQGECWFELSVASRQAVANQDRRYIALARDITSRKCAESALKKSESRYRHFAEKLPLGIVITQDGLIKYINSATTELIGYPEGELLGRPFLPLVFESDRLWMMELHQQRMRGEDVDSPYMVRMTRKDGKVRQWQIHASTIEFDGKPSGLGIIADVTEKTLAEAALRVAAVAFESQEGMIVTDADGVILQVNQAFTQTTGYTAEEAVGRTPSILRSGRHDASFYREMWETIHRAGTWQGEIWDRRKNGEVYPKWLTISAVKNEAGVVTHYVGSHTDITERKAMDDAIKSMAFYDTLTQLPNRRLLDDRLRKALSASKRSGRYGAAMFLDLDNFKPLNDAHGHSVGDALLVEVARRLTHCVREVDTVARFGGDEFVVVLSELDEGQSEYTAQASNVAEKIRSALAEPYLLILSPEDAASRTVEHHCAASIGVALFNSEVSAEDVLKYADMAMYQAKEAGRNQIWFYEP